ncbi:MAG: hypothetical protein PVH87_24560 [Desulfobacteraceae bacterium]|jgi:hypothetical protein
METVAVYWEPQIKTYGFQVVRELAMYTCAIPADLPPTWEGALTGLDNGRRGFELVCGQMNDAGGIDLLLLYAWACRSEFARRVEAVIPIDAARPKQAIGPVELIFFQGPHFGDRFGIADFTYRALGDHAERLLAAVFSCASVYLVLPEGGADAAKERLSAAFRIPG